MASCNPGKGVVYNLVSRGKSAMALMPHSFAQSLMQSHNRQFMQHGRYSRRPKNKLLQPDYPHASTSQPKNSAGWPPSCILRNQKVW